MKRFSELNTEKTPRLYSKYIWYYQAYEAIMFIIILLFLGVINIIICILTLCLQASFDEKIARDFMFVLFLCFASVLVIGGLLLIRRYKKHKALVKLILEKGLVTDGVIEEIRSKRYKYRTERGWKYKVFYAYKDENDIEQREVFFYRSPDENHFYKNQGITVAFCEGQSAMVEY